MSRILEADQSGALTIPGDLLGSSRPRARFLVETDGSGIHIEPEQLPAVPDQASEDWMTRWLDLAGKIGEASTTDDSAVEILSGMRR